MDCFLGVKCDENYCICWDGMSEKSSESVECNSFVIDMSISAFLYDSDISARWNYLAVFLDNSSMQFALGLAEKDAMTAFLSFKRSNGHVLTTYAVSLVSISISCWGSSMRGIFCGDINTCAMP